ncbi:MAG: DUF444 family protein [Deltaproteobacteria bacterium]|nr:DUF444 family protein [Deltaproteobacteria bacterium]
MSSSIKQDHARFREIVRGRIKQNLRKYISKGELIGRQGKDLISIPLPQIDVPRFRFGQKQQGGVGSGEGEPGDTMGQGEPQPGSGEAGEGEGQHVLEMDVSLDELASILGEDLELPRIEPKGKKSIESVKLRYSGIHHVGPNALRHFRRSFKQALKRSIAAGTYDAKNPIIIPIRDDLRFRSWKEIRQPESNAVIILMMDVSGSMGDDQKELVRIETFWIDTWLRSQYEGIETRYIIHDAVAREVDRDTFFHTRESGGTMISSAYKLCKEIIEAEYDPESWNIYPFHFSDGDNWSAEDSRLCLSLLKESLVPWSNMFCYGQVDSPYGSGQFIKDLKEAFPQEEKVIWSEIPDRDGIYRSIKDFLGKGK